MLYQSDTWREPAPRVFDPPFVLAAGKTVSFSCTYHNETGVEIKFGNSAVTDEMCILGLRGYPVPKLAAGFVCF
jgi:hypothetical protein